VLLVSIPAGFSILLIAGKPVSGAIDTAAKVFFGIIRIVVRAAPIGAFGAMAFTIGAPVKLGELILTFNLTSTLFVLGVVGTISYRSGFSILRFIASMKDELLIVLGTRSSETVLPHMMQKMEHLGASKSEAVSSFRQATRAGSPLYRRQAAAYHGFMRCGSAAPVGN
jgi:aerobic C4-dicarboxylate transport protein